MTARELTENPIDWKRMWLCLIAFVAGAAVPIQLVTLSFGYAQYIQGIPKGPEMLMAAHQFAAYYIPFLYLPALVLLGGIALHSRKPHPGLFRRITIGFGMGAISTLALDAVRQMGVIHGWLPGDTTVLFGKMATGSASFSVYWPVGVAVHYINGANFGLFYAFVFGKRRSWFAAVMTATAWALTLELMMMIGPPMARMAGIFGQAYAWPAMFLVTGAAHVFFGVALGLLIQCLLREGDRDWLIPFLFKRSPSAKIP